MRHRNVPTHVARRSQRLVDPIFIVFVQIKYTACKVEFQIIVFLQIKCTACKVEFQPFNRSYSQLTFFNFYKIKSYLTTALGIILKDQR